MKTLISGLGILGLAASGAAMLSAPAFAQSEYRQQISNNMRQCAPGQGPAVRVTLRGVKNASGKVRIQVYRGTREDWLESGRYLNRIEVPARRGTMTFCLPVPASGSYAIAARHDVNGNNETDIRQDGGAMSNNPSINIFNLGRPSVSKTRFNAGSGVSAISMQMRYFG
ncbi:MAG: DUF2141 domain-containing protein [Erythrobacter sp.]